MQQGPQRAQNNIMKSVMQYEFRTEAALSKEPRRKKRTSPQGQGHTESLQSNPELFSALYMGRGCFNELAVIFKSICFCKQIHKLSSNGVIY